MGWMQADTRWDRVCNAFGCPDLSDACQTGRTAGGMAACVWLWVLIVKLLHKVCIYMTTPPLGPVCWIQHEARELLRGTVQSLIADSHNLPNIIRIGSSQLTPPIPRHSDLNDRRPPFPPIPHNLLTILLPNPTHKLRNHKPNLLPQHHHRRMPRARSIRDALIPPRDERLHLTQIRQIPPRHPRRGGRGRFPALRGGEVRRNDDEVPS